MFNNIRLGLVLSTFCATGMPASAGFWLIEPDIDSSDDVSVEIDNGNYNIQEFSEPLVVEVVLDVTNTTQQTATSGDANEESHQEIGWVWQGGGPADAECFELKWAGSTSGSRAYCTAGTIDDYVSSEAVGYANVGSGDFTSDDDKWQVGTNRYALLPSGPENGKEIERTVAGKIKVELGLPPTISGEIEINPFAGPRDAERTVEGQESYDTTAIPGVSVATFNHPGGAVNHTVSATAYHTGSVSMLINCSTLQGHNVTGRAKVVARTTIFSIERG